jgi:CelD/BcsL family acetyltransferase involved in cellulose biosynthesis
VTDLEELGGLEASWRRLAEERGNAFVTPEWCRCWMRHYGEGTAPLVLVARGEDGEVSGLLPLVQSGRGRFRKLRFPGANLGDYFHAVAPIDREAAVAAQLATTVLAQRRPAWGSLILDHVGTDRIWWRELCRGISASRTRPYRTNVLPWIELAGVTWEAYLAGRSRNLRSQIRRKTNGLAERHELRFRRSAAQPELDADMQTFFRLHAERWKGRGGSAALTDRSRAFHADFAAAALERNWLRLWFLELDGEPVAAWYGWRVGDRYAYYLSGFSPRFAALSVGFVLLAQTIREAIEEGASRYDLLMGAEPYKLRFATGVQPVATVVATPRAHPLRLVAALDASLWRAGRRLPPGIRDRIRRLYSALVALTPAGRRR